ncbi:hypothetical protein FQR65_LT20866 [Abscondita terminalis]|nr:hypothetical protein FQR65_LT20866 [Abscondita terminalis]
MSAAPSPPRSRSRRRQTHGDAHVKIWPTACREPFAAGDTISGNFPWGAAGSRSREITRRGEGGCRLRARIRSAQSRRQCLQRRQPDATAAEPDDRSRGLVRRGRLWRRLISPPPPRLAIRRPPQAPAQQDSMSPPATQTFTTSATAMASAAASASAIAVANSDLSASAAIAADPARGRFDSNASRRRGRRGAAARFRGACHRRQLDQFELQGPDRGEPRRPESLSPRHRVRDIPSTNCAGSIGEGVNIEARHNSASPHSTRCRSPTPGRLGRAQAMTLLASQRIWESSTSILTDAMPTPSSQRTSSAGRGINYFRAGQQLPPTSPAAPA